MPSLPSHACNQISMVKTHSPAAVRICQRRQHNVHRPTPNKHTVYSYQSNAVNRYRVAREKMCPLVSQYPVPALECSVLEQCAPLRCLALALFKLTFFVNSLSSAPSISFLLPDPTNQNVFLAALLLRRSSPLHTPRQTQSQVQHCHKIIRALGSGRHRFAHKIKRRSTIHSRCTRLLTARCAKVDYATAA